RRIEQAIAEALLEIGERKQLLAQLGAVLQLETPDAADLVGRLRALDCRGRDRRMPAVVTVEIAQHVPDHSGRRIKDRAFDDMRHTSLQTRVSGHRSRPETRRRRSY